ncbi:coxsackievirus and adenovirus receptor homolog [Phycodurus eques]|uniref:coxsackievirus and adenovirus receptor homolog n=1 Tax=Phycodurus eques TaxID=693459 RepID=UPI002ACDCA2C|nr:coxsackievirus and adenovirus receptor homolog [Phycodurus eques]
MQTQLKETLCDTFWSASAVFWKSWSSVYMEMMCRLLWPFVLLGVLCSIGPACTLEISMNRKHNYAATGTNVTLACQYTHTLESTQHTEITWSIVSADQDEKTILWFTGGRLYPVLYKPLEGRLQFTSANPQNGDASINITDVRLSDSTTYQCLVKKLPELDLKNVDLTVMEVPSQPQCSVDRELAEGHGMTLKCGSLHGTPPLRYTWSKTSEDQVLPPNAIVDTVEGTLRNIFESDCGRYRCTVASMVANKHCDLVLKCSLFQDTDVDSQQSPKTAVANSQQSPKTAVTVTVVFVTIFVVTTVVIAVAFYRQQKKKSLDLSNTLALS